MIATDNHSAQSPSICVVRVRTTAWTDKRGLHKRKSLLFLRKQSTPNGIEDDLNAIDPLVFAKSIINFDECEDGVYQVVTCNERIDWETGCLEEYDYKLVAHVAK